MQYRYVGPGGIVGEPIPIAAGRVASTADLDRWLADRDTTELAEPFTFIVDLETTLWLAPRRTEHVACARGREVLAAGEISFDLVEDRWVVGTVSNQSTGYCPDLESWLAVAAALDRAGVSHPGRYTEPVIFRRCGTCGERNIVRDRVFFCAICDGELPERWNFDEP